MCGRFALTLPTDAMAQLFAARAANDLPDLPDYNICPTNRVVTIHGGAAGRRLSAMRWGFLPHWYKSPSSGPPLINARAETIAEKPAFADAARQRRCLIPVSGFYEWTVAANGGRLPWYISGRFERCLALAGIWQEWGNDAARQACCAIVTTAAGQDVAHLHNRQPVIIAQQHWPMWLGEEGPGAARLMTATPPGQLQAWRVDTAVNSNRARGPDLLRPLPATRPVDHSDSAGGGA